MSQPDDIIGSVDGAGYFSRAHQGFWTTPPGGTIARELLRLYPDNTLVIYDTKRRTRRALKRAVREYPRLRTADTAYLLRLLRPCVLGGRCVHQRSIPFTAEEAEDGQEGA